MNHVVLRNAENIKMENSKLALKGGKKKGNYP